MSFHSVKRNFSSGCEGDDAKSPDCNFDNGTSNSWKKFIEKRAVFLKANTYIKNKRFKDLSWKRHSLILKKKIWPSKCFLCARSLCLVCRIAFIGRFNRPYCSTSPLFVSHLDYGQQCNTDINTPVKVSFEDVGIISSFVVEAHAVVSC